MKKRAVLLIALPLTFHLSCAQAANGWQNYMTVSGNYFEGEGTPNIALEMDSTFNTCGWNYAGQISESTVGASKFRLLSSVVLTALASGKKLSVFVEGCVGDRANITRLRIE